MPSASKTETNERTEADPGLGPADGGTPRGGLTWRSGRFSRSPGARARTQEIGRELFERIGRGPKPWHRAWWEDRFMAGTLDDPLVRVQLFRFIDVLPALKTTESVRRHLAEYLAEAGDRVPWWLGLALRLAPAGSTRAEWLAEAARAAAGVMARKFIAGATPDEARQTVLALRRRRLAFTADLLGEAVISEAEADLYQQTCLTLIRGLDGPAGAAAEVPLIDRDQNGPIPRVNLSLKLSSLTAQFDAIHAEATIDRVAGRLRPILRAARELGAYVHVDMEQYAYRALSYELFCRVLEEPEFRDWPDVGIVVQAYHAEAENELRMLATGSSAGARRSRSGWSRGRTGTTRSRPRGSWAGPSRSTCRSGRATRPSSVAPGSWSSTMNGSARPSAATMSAAWRMRSPPPRPGDCRQSPTSCKRSSAWAT